MSTISLAAGETLRLVREVRDEAGVTLDLGAAERVYLAIDGAEYDATVSGATLDVSVDHTITAGWRGYLSWRLWVHWPEGSAVERDVIEAGTVVIGAGGAGESVQTIVAAMPGSGGATTLGGLSDVSTAGASAGQILGYDGTSWAPVDAATAGGLDGAQVDARVAAALATYDARARVTAQLGDADWERPPRTDAEIETLIAAAFAAYDPGTRTDAEIDARVAVGLAAYDPGVRTDAEIDARVALGIAAVDFSSAVDAEIGTSWREAPPVASVAGLTGAIGAAPLLAALGIEAGATADQSASEIAALYAAEVPAISTAEIEAGTGTAVRRTTPADLRAAVLAHRPRQVLTQAAYDAIVAPDPDTDYLIVEA